MSKKLKFSLFSLTIALLYTASANAVSIYDNNISALNINMFSDTFMSYTNYGEKMSDLFMEHNMYGTMTRIDEYGDDGSSLIEYKIDSGYPYSNDTFIKDIWANANHINGDVHYGNNISEHGRFNFATVGTTTKTIDLNTGNIYFGGFVSYIKTKVKDTKSSGDSVGLFANYKYKNIGARVLINNGSLVNDAGIMNYTNSWFNTSAETYATLKIDETFYFKPSVYVGYTWVSSDDLYLDGQRISSSDFNFLNIAPGAKFIKKIAKDWYGALSGKYVANFIGNNDITVGDTTVGGLKIENHTDVGVDIEYNFRHFVFGGKVHKQIGGIDSWVSNLNVKYVF